MDGRTQDARPGILLCPASVGAWSWARGGYPATVDVTRVGGLVWVHVYVLEPKPGQATWLHGAPEVCPSQSPAPCPQPPAPYPQKEGKRPAGQKTESMDGHTPPTPRSLHMGSVLAWPWTHVERPGVAADPPWPGSQQLWAWLCACPLHPGGLRRWLRWVVGSLAISRLGVK